MPIFKVNAGKLKNSMMEEIIRTSEMLSAVKWYFELKNLSLRNVLALRSPLSVENQTDLRMYYSQYFAGLLSATELFLEKEYSRSQEFEQLLYEKLVFEGFSDGEMNYSYLCELRNSIIHRGLDVSSSAHFNIDFPMLISPSPVTNRKGTKFYTPFGDYLIDVIEKCESVVGDIFLNHFEKFNLLQMRLPQEKAVELSKKFISDSNAMPAWAKVMALKSVENINHEEIHEVSVKNLVAIIKTNVFATNHFA